MPPFIPRKRPSASPPTASQPTPTKRAKLADVLDAEARNVPGLERKETFSVGGSDDSDSSLSDVDSDQFEEVPYESKRSSAPVQKHEDDEEEDIEWEDAANHKRGDEHLPDYKPQSDGPIEITLRKRDDDGENWLEQAAANMKKGPSKRDKQVRICTHQLHVQFLLWHNAIRNRWVSDREVQQILVQGLPSPIKKEVDKWKRRSGLALAEESKTKANAAKSKSRGKQVAADLCREREWGRPSQRLEKGQPDMSNGDPLILLLKVLAAYWKKNFSITAPGLRKGGYGTVRERKQIVQSLQNDEYDPERHGERILHVHEFRELARKLEGSRDVGAQLFTALLRGLGIEARLVASLQPCGYGWTKAEQRLPRKPVQAVDADTSSGESDSADVRSISEITTSRGHQKNRGKTTATRIAAESDEDDESIIDVTPSRKKKQSQKYDRDHPFPIYWTEAISPVTNQIFPVSPLVLSTPVATTPDTLGAFEPRGIKAEKTKTVMAYVIAYSSDGTAKDVTVRYLKKHIWPGKTKGFRYPIEKIPIYNKHGKVKRYEDYDWFKRLMSFYARPDLLRTPVDDIEDATDLVPQRTEQKDVSQGVDTLQSLKSSADFVLERFLRREEALRTNATPVRTFISGKGDKLKHEPVYRRADVERCLTAESWHKEGRRPKNGEAPLKLVPVRAVTITRKREAEEHERVTGEKQMQGLYSWDQTEYIVPPPIVDGKIPKNAYGNIDCFVPSMVPRGAVHIPLRGTVRICKKLEIDFAEAVTGFEFGNKRAVPVCTGVVVAKENARAVTDAWHEYNEVQRAKEEKKLEAIVLDTWRKFVIGLRIRERVKDTYGEDAIDEWITGRSAGQPVVVESDHEVSVAQQGGDPAEDDDAGGGFFPDSDDEHSGSDLEIGYHPNDDRDIEAPHMLQHSRSKGPERAGEAHYPTPQSVSPPKLPLRRQRLGRSRLGEDEDDEISDLSSAPLSSINTSRSGSEAAVANSVVDDGEPSRRIQDSSDSEMKGASDDDSSDDKSEGYKPSRFKARTKPNTLRRTGRPPGSSTKSTPQSEGQQRLTRKSTRVRKEPDASAATRNEADDENVDEESRTTTISNRRSKPPANRATPKRRPLRSNSTVVTSPYFDI
ncbi:rad4 family protein [Cladophialophora carrionii]|uniref:Rad4 family protein n=1 Tax=Cladophialophora carrionii TaxID=86049 RepID=A0A1C1CQS7_9EURO|nr:rad4 family protein [Cladophialophora carrionii]